MDIRDVALLIKDSHRYRLVKGQAMTLLLRDDGETLSYMIVAPDDMSEIGKWRPWVNIRHSEIPSAAFLIIDALMREGGEQLRTE